MKIKRLNELVHNKLMTPENKAKEIERITFLDDKTANVKTTRLFSRVLSTDVDNRVLDPALIFQYKGDKVIVNEFLDWIYTVVQNLTERERICWWERVINGKTYKEISETHGYWVRSVPRCVKQANGYIKDMLKFCPLDLKEVKSALRGYE